MAENAPDQDRESADEPQGEPIPEVLHSFYEERPFVSCTRCGESLADFEEGFRVSKNFKKEEVIFEYALCMPCLNGMMDEASDESKQRLEEFHEEHARDVSGFSECALCEKTLESSREEEYSLVGVCHGEKMYDSALICGDCLDRLAEITSEETRRGWDRFKEENFPGVPGDLEPMPARPAPALT